MSQPRAEAQRLERLELNAVDVLASLWAQAHPATTPVAATGVESDPLLNVEAVIETAPSEPIDAEANPSSARPIIHVSSTTRTKKSKKMAKATVRELHKIALEVIEKVKRDNRVLGLYNLKQGVDRVLEHFHNWRRPRTVSKRRRELELALLIEVKKDLAVLVPKPKLRFVGVEGITKVIRFTAGS